MNNDALFYFSSQQYSIVILLIEVMHRQGIEEFILFLKFKVKTEFIL